MIAEANQTKLLAALQVAYARNFFDGSTAMVARIKFVGHESRLSVPATPVADEETRPNQLMTLGTFFSSRGEHVAGFLFSVTVAGAELFSAPGIFRRGRRYK